MLGESVQVEHTNSRRTAAAAMAVAGQDAQIHPSPALKTYHFQWSGFMMMWEENIGCTGRVSPLQLQVTYINITLTTLICPLQPRTKTSAVGPRETQGPTMLTTHTILYPSFGFLSWQTLAKVSTILVSHIFRCVL